jgi:hypothetical protein
MVLSRAKEEGAGGKGKAIRKGRKTAEPLYL